MVVWGWSSVGGVRVVLALVGLGVVRGGLGWLPFFTWRCIAPERPRLPLVRVRAFFLFGIYFLAWAKLACCLKNKIK